MTVCFLGTNILNALEGNVVGGSEKQQAIIIEELKRESVNVMVLEYYLETKKVVNDIEIYPAWGNNNKSFFSRLKSIVRQLQIYQVDVLYVRGTQLYAAALSCYFKIKKPKIKLFWGIAGDHDLTSKFNYLRTKNVSSIYGKINAGIIFNISSFLLYLFSYIIICQTTEQLNRCKAISSKKRSILISNIYLNNFRNLKIKGPLGLKANAIWIGKFAGNKGEDILLNIARDIPEIKIICLGHATEEFLRLDLFKQIRDQHNLVLLGRINNDQVGSFISVIDFVLNTSPSEGLSNVFLEGWDMEKPVISYKVDPNKYLSDGQAGYCANGSYNELVTKLKEIQFDQDFIEQHGKKGKEILNKNHSPEVIIPKYIQIFGS